MRITREQAATAYRQLTPHHRYLRKLFLRVEQVAPDTPLYDKAKAAYDAVHALSMAFHYLSCAEPNSRPP